MIQRRYQAKATCLMDFRWQRERFLNIEQPLINQSGKRDSPLPLLPQRSALS